MFLLLLLNPSFLWCQGVHVTCTAHADGDNALAAPLVQLTPFSVMWELSGDVLYTSGAPGPFSSPLPGVSQRRMQSLAGGTPYLPAYSEMQSLNSMPVDTELNDWDVGPAFSDCDVWSENAGLAGDEIPGASMHTDNRDECKELCFSTPGCKAVTFNKESHWCWIQSLQDGDDDEPAELEGNALHVCHAARLQRVSLDQLWQQRCGTQLPAALSSIFVCASYALCVHLWALLFARSRLHLCPMHGPRCSIDTRLLCTP